MHLHDDGNAVSAAFSKVKFTLLPNCDIDSVTTGSPQPTITYRIFQQAVETILSKIEQTNPTNCSLAYSMQHLDAELGWVNLDVSKLKELAVFTPAARKLRLFFEDNRLSPSNVPSIFRMRTTGCNPVNHCASYEFDISLIKDCTSARVFLTGGGFSPTTIIYRAGNVPIQASLSKPFVTDKMCAVEYAIEVRTNISSTVEDLNGRFSRLLENMTSATAPTFDFSQNQLIQVYSKTDDVQKLNEFWKDANGAVIEYTVTVTMKIKDTELSSGGRATASRSFKLRLDSFCNSLH